MGTYNVLDKNLKEVLLGQYVSEQVKAIDDNFKSLGAISEDLDDKITTVKNEAHKSVSYATLEELVDTVNPLAKNSFNVADNIFIKELNVPDFWVSEIKDTQKTATVADFGSSDYNNVQVGYFVLNKLETQKVDMTNSVTADSNLTADEIMLGAGNKKAKTSGKKIVTTMDGLDTSVPTSKAVETRLTTVQNSINASINNIINGTTTVGKATNDSDGNKISTTYEKKANKATDLSTAFTDDTKYPSAKATKSYVDTSVANAKTSIASTYQTIANMEKGTAVSNDETKTKYPSSYTVYTWVTSVTNSIKDTIAKSIDELTSDIKDGTVVASKAKADQKGNVIDTTYATKDELSEVSKTAGKIDSIDFVTGTQTTGYVVPITDKVAKPKVIGSGVDVVLGSADGIKIKTKASNTVGAITVNGKKPTHTSTPTSDDNGGSYASVNLKIVSADESTTKVATDDDGTVTIAALGKVRDVKVNGASVVDTVNGTANIEIDDLEGEFETITSSDSRWISDGTNYLLKLPIATDTHYSLYNAAQLQMVVQEQADPTSGYNVINVGTTKPSTCYLRKIKGNAVGTSGGTTTYLYNVTYDTNGSYTIEGYSGVSNIVNALMSVHFTALSQTDYGNITSGQPNVTALSEFCSSHGNSVPVSGIIVDTNDGIFLPISAISTDDGGYLHMTTANGKNYKVHLDYVSEYRTKSTLTLSGGVTSNSSSN